MIFCVFRKEEGEAQIQEMKQTFTPVVNAKDSSVVTFTNSTPDPMVRTFTVTGLSLQLENGKFIQ